MKPKARLAEPQQNLEHALPKSGLLCDSVQISFLRQVRILKKPMVKYIKQGRCEG